MINFVRHWRKSQTKKSTEVCMVVKKINLSLSILAAALMLNACGSMEYIDRKSFAEIKENKNITSSRSYQGGELKDFGVIAIKNPVKNNLSEVVSSQEEDAFYLHLKRKDYNYYVEANLFNSGNYEKSYIDEAIVDVGTTRHLNALSMGVTMRF